MEDQQANSSQDRSTPLDHVVDDLEPKLRCAQWVGEQLAEGRTAEELAVELEAGGMDPDEAAELVEDVRRQTRRQRGVLTREEVVRTANSRYRQTMRPTWLIGYPAIAAAERTLIHLIGDAIMRKRR